MDLHRLHPRTHPTLHAFLSLGTHMPPMGQDDQVNDTPGDHSAISKEDNDEKPKEMAIVALEPEGETKGRGETGVGGGGMKAVGAKCGALGGTLHKTQLPTQGQW
jgi:hypothetical protein